MTPHEIELKALKLTSLDGDAASHRALLGQLSRRLRAYFKGKLAGIGRGASEAEDLVQEAVNPTEPLTPWVHECGRIGLRYPTEGPHERVGTGLEHDRFTACEVDQDFETLGGRDPDLL
jgi:hypothetical protein